MNPAHKLLLAAVAQTFFLAAPMLAEPAPTPPQESVIIDEDWNVPGDYICEANLALFPPSGRAKILALTSVTGDAWRDEGTANVLRFLEETGRTNIPVANGAAFPLINTPGRLAAWEKLYGALSWKGAWNDSRHEKTAHPDTPFAIRLPKEGAPQRMAATPENAVSLLIRLVHEHPHEITIVSGGPMTNLALAIRQDPQFASLAKRLVLGSARIREALDADASAHTAARRPVYNFVFDPEAAHIALTAEWPEIVCFDPIEDKDPVFDEKLLARMQEHPTAYTRYLAANTGFGTPLWAAARAYVADPSLVKAERRVRAPLGVDLDERSPLFGSIVALPSALYAGPPGGGRFTIITDFDWDRYVSAYVAALQTPSQ